MYLSKITLHRGIDINVLAQIVRGDSYRAHQIIWSLFEGDPNGKRNFIFRRDDEGKWPRFYVVSSIEPGDSSGHWGIESKLYAPKLHAGQRLSFTMRANPVRTREGKRHDVVMEVKTELKKSGKPQKDWPPIAEIVQSKGVEWLDTRSANYGFSINDGEVRVDGYRQHTFYKGKGKHTIRFSTIDFTGLLSITNPEKFLIALYGGIGPAKGFGCGMMMVRNI